MVEPELRGVGGVICGHGSTDHVVDDVVIVVDDVQVEITETTRWYFEDVTDAFHTGRFTVHTPA